MDPFQARRLRISQKFTLLKETFAITDDSDQPLLWADLPILQLKEQVNVYADEAKSQLVLRLLQRDFLTLAPVYDIFDAQATLVASLKVQPLKSIMAVNWQLLDANGNQMGAVQESGGKAVAADFFGSLVPRQFSLQVSNGQTASYVQGFQPFLLRMQMDFDPELDGRIGVAVGVALAHYTISREHSSGGDHGDVSGVGPGN